MTTNNKLTITTNDILSGLNKIKTRKNNKYDFNQVLKIAKNSDKTYLTYCNLPNTITTELGYNDTEFNGEINVKLFDLLDTVKDVKDVTDVIEIEQKDDKVEVNAGYLTITLDTKDAPDTPETLPEDANNFTLTFDNLKEVKKFIKDLEYLKKHSDNSINANIPVLTGINFRNDPTTNKLLMRSLDGFRIMFSEYSSIGDEVEFTISKDTLNDLIYILKNNQKEIKKVTFGQQDAKLAIKVNDVTLYGKMLNGKFFDTDSVFNPPGEDEAINITIDKNKLNKTLNLIKKKTEDDNNLMVLEKMNLCNFVTVRSMEDNVSANFTHNDNNEFKVGFNSDFVLDAISNIDNDVTITLTKDQLVAPCYIFDNNNKYVILPVRLDN